MKKVFAILFCVSGCLVPTLFALFAGKLRPTMVSRPEATLIFGITIGMILVFAGACLTDWRWIWKLLIPILSIGIMMLLVSALAYGLVSIGIVPLEGAD